MGWSFSQVSHMSLVPALTDDEPTRVQLNSLRYAGTILSNTLVLAIFFGYQAIIPSFEVQFELLGGTVVFLGFVATAIFLKLTPEEWSPSLTKSNVTLKSKSPRIIPSAAFKVLDTENGVNATDSNMLAWFHVVDFYKVGLNYTMTRLAVNFAQVFLPIYLVVSLNMSYAIAVVPLLVYVISFCCSPFTKTLTVVFGFKKLYIFGSILMSVSSLLLLVAQPSFSYLVFAIAALLGVGTTIISLVSVSYEAQLIGVNCQTSAFVYGTISFCDKLVNGVAILFVQMIREDIGSNDSLYVRLNFALVPALACIVACYFTLDTSTQRPRQKPLEKCDEVSRV